MGAGFCLGKKKSGVLSYVSLISRDLTNYFPRNFSILNAMGKKRIYSKRIAFMFQKLEQSKSFSWVSLSLSPSPPLLFFPFHCIFLRYKEAGSRERWERLDLCFMDKLQPEEYPDCVLAGFSYTTATSHPWFQKCPTFWHLWVTMEEKELSWVTH